MPHSPLTWWQPARKQVATLVATHTSFSLFLSFITYNISTWTYENEVSKHFVISLNFPCLIACLLSCSLMWFFFVHFVVWALCRCGCRQNFASFYLLAPLSPSLCFFFFILPTILSLTQVTFNEISARLKLASVPFSSLHFVIGHLEKSFTESTM